MSETPRVSVVMCAYNGMGVIEQAVGDILAQRFDDWELVISDDGSTDGTRDYLAGLDDLRIRVILQDRNLGYVRNKNAAIAAARGELITQQDQDDRTDPDRLPLMVGALDRTGHAIVGAGYRKLDVAGKLQFQTALEREIVITAYDPAVPYPFWFPALLVRREVFSEIGLFDEFFAGAFGDDLYWTVKANERFAILCIPQPLYMYRESAGSITSTLDDPRKLVMGGVLRHLVDQRRATGSDDLERGDLAALAATEQRILADRHYLSEQYRTFAARSIDQGRLGEARRLLGKALAIRPWRLSLFRTTAYYLRARLFR